MDINFLSSIILIIITTANWVLIYTKKDNVTFEDKGLLIILSIILLFTFLAEFIFGISLYRFLIGDFK